MVPTFCNVYIGDQVNIQFERSRLEWYRHNLGWPERNDAGKIDGSWNQPTGIAIDSF